MSGEVLKAFVDTSPMHGVFFYISLYILMHWVYTAAMSVSKVTTYYLFQHALSVWVFLIGLYCVLIEASPITKLVGGVLLIASYYFGCKFKATIDHKLKVLKRAKEIAMKRHDLLDDSYVE